MTNSGKASIVAPVSRARNTSPIPPTPMPVLTSYGPSREPGDKRAGLEVNDPLEMRQQTA